MDNTSHPASRRHHLRVDYGREMVVRLQNGVVLAGKISNFSASGFFIDVAPERMAACSMNTVGVLLIEEMPGEMLELSCRIVRLEEEGVAFMFDD